MDKHVIRAGVKIFSTKALRERRGYFPLTSELDGVGRLKQSPATIPPGNGDGTNFTSCWVSLWTGAEKLDPTEFRCSYFPGCR
jgi:hypothetical protein